MKLLTLKSSTDPVGVAFVKVSFCIDADIKDIGEFDVTERDDNCFEDHRRRNL